MTPLKAGAFLDWGAKPPSIPAGMEYIHVLRVRETCDRLVYVEDTVTKIWHWVWVKEKCASLTPPQKTPYQTSLDSITPPNSTLKSIIKTYPGGFWIIGNEPDTTYGNQDDLTADVYASRFFTIAKRIRALDPTAKIGFGSIVQPTPIRLRYLDQAWAKLVSLAGSVQKASSLIDIWTSHAFILNETGGWGTGIPPGFEDDHADAVVINPPYSDTYSISIFSKRIKDFRQWLQKKGEQNKPLWITEYGSLIPPIYNPDENNATLSDAITLRYMISTFDFMMTAADPSTGMPLDNNHLVQSWFWYSLNDYRDTFGGSLFDIGLKGHPLPPTLTEVGTAFMNYAPKNNIISKFQFTKDPSLSIDPAVPSHLNISFRVANIGTSSRQAARVWVYRDEPNGTPLAVIDTLPFQGCGDSMLYSGAIDYPASALGFSKLYFRLDTNGDGAPHSDDEIVVLDAPPAVSGLTAVARSRTRIRLDWTGSPNADGYRIERSADGGTTWNNQTSVLKGTPTTYMSTGLTCNIPYQYRVRAYNSQGYWGSNVASARTDTCTTPAISVLAMSQKRINLSWVNTLVTASGFKVQRSLNGSSGWQDVGTAPGDAVGYSDYSDILIKSLACGTPYYYRIQPFNNNDAIPDNWSLSNTAHTSTNPCGPPPKPILATNPHTSHSNVLTWTQLDDADTYQLERSLNFTTGWISLGSPLSQDTTRFLDQQAEPGITFYYHVRATNLAYGDSLFRAAVPVQTYLYDFFTPFVLR
ncbi:MAG: fibronectin type III domain-containing protein [Planctomycetes bacterium]|nr:fibronectin type III domain-containing protein [Planctomycetota bacterium]